MKSLLLYVALVGLPLLGVLGILHVGRGLAPPPSFGGVWRLAAEEDAGGAGCAPSGAALRVEQSGRRARVRLGEATATADVGGHRLRTRTPLVMGTGPCAGWYVEAERLGSGGADASGPVQLVGRLLPASPEGCSCAPVSFRAEREAVSPTPAAH